MRLLHLPLWVLMLIILSLLDLALICLGSVESYIITQVPLSFPFQMFLQNLPKSISMIHKNSWLKGS